MRFSTLYLFLLCSLPTYAITGGEARVSFYRTCPDDAFTTDDLSDLISESKRPAITLPAASSAASSTQPSSSSSVSAVSAPLHTSSVFTGKKSLFRALLAAARPDSTTGFSTDPFNITQGECKAVPIVTPTHADSSSVSVSLKLLSVTPFQQCNMTLHEVAGCIDEPLLTTPVKDRQAKSECTERNFSAWSDVWVRLDCEEAAAGRHDASDNNAAETSTKMRRMGFWA